MEEKQGKEGTWKTRSFSFYFPVSLGHPTQQACGKGEEEPEAEGEERRAQGNAAHALVYFPWEAFKASQPSERDSKLSKATESHRQELGSAN